MGATALGLQVVSIGRQQPFNRLIFSRYPPRLLSSEGLRLSCDVLTVSALVGPLAVHPGHCCAGRRRCRNAVAFGARGELLRGCSRIVGADRNPVGLAVVGVTPVKLSRSG